MRRRRSRQPRSDLPIEPGLLLVGIVYRHERPEAVRAHVTGDDHEIAWRDVGKEPVLVAEGDDPHFTSGTSLLRSPLPVEHPDERLGIAEGIVDRVMIVLGPPQSLPLLRAAEVADQASVEVGDTPAGVPERVLAEVAPEVEIDPLKVVGRVVRDEDNRLPRFEPLAELAERLLGAVRAVEGLGAPFSRRALKSTAPNSVISPTDGAPTPNGASQSTTIRVPIAPSPCLTKCRIVGDDAASARTSSPRVAMGRHAPMTHSLSLISL